MKSILRNFPGMNALRRTWAWQVIRNHLALRFDPRTNSHFTGFLRLPTQYDALAGPVVDYLLRDDPSRALRISVVGCSNGAEAYSIASVLRTRRPGLKFTVHGFDIEPKVVEYARIGRYQPEQEIYNNRHLPKDFVESTFDVTDGVYSIKKDLLATATFGVLDVLDAAALARIAPSDIVFAQNFLFHLEPAMARQAMRNIVGLMGPKSVLFADGTDIGLRQRLAGELSLEPLDFKIREIHAEAGWARAEGWPYRYWGLEPISDSRPDWKHRYATIFLRNAA
jgi:chemotaxis protein methyltransferase CheR